MDTWEYTCNQSPPEAFKTVRFYVRTKVLELNGGAALNGEGIDLDFLGFDGVARIRFAKTKEGSRVSVTVPDSLRDKVSTLMAGLVAKHKLKSVNKHAPAENVEKRSANGVRPHLKSSAPKLTPLPVIRGSRTRGQAVTREALILNPKVQGVFGIRLCW